MAITIVFPADTSPQLTLTLPSSNWGEESGFIFTDDIQRAIDGTMNSYRSYRKRRKALKWDYLTPTQKSNLEDLYAFACPFTFADSVDLANQFTAFMIAAPIFRQVANGFWEGEVEVQEI